MRSALLSFCTILTIWCHAQQSGYYEQQWKRVDSLIILARLPKSALDATKKIEQTATKEKNEAQQIKALLYLQTLGAHIEDQQDLSTQIEQYKNRLTAFSRPAQAVVHAIIAANYLSGFERKQRFGATHEKLFNNWTFQDFDSAINAHYTQALSIAETKSIPALSMTPVLLENKQAWYGLSVYDVLIQQAIGYYTKQLDMSDQNLTSYIENRQILLQPLSLFLEKKLPLNKRNHLETTIRLYQDWMHQHSTDVDKQILAAINLQRLNWGRQIIPHQEGADAYTNALKEAIELMPCEASYAAYYSLAKAQMELGESYRPFTDTTYRYAFVEAIRFIKTGLSRTNDSNLREALEGLKKKITQPEIRLQTENVQVPKQPFRALLHFRNTEQLYTRIIRLPADSFKDTISGLPKRRDQLDLLPIYRSETITLTDTKDYQTHITEIKIDALPVGKYLLICSTDPSFRKNEAALTVNTIWVSQLSYVRNKNHLFVIDRQSGEPVKDVRVEVFEYVYEKQKPSKQLATGFTDMNGQYTYTGPFNKTLHFRFIDKKDSLDFNAMYYSRYFEDPNYTPVKATRDQLNVFYFTDRNIYRPGQWLYAKALVIKKGYSLSPSLDTSKQPITFYLKNVHQKIIDSVKAVISDFGSATASFQIPEQGLTGNYSIYTSLDPYYSHTIKVEAYKRPSFLISFDKVATPYRINDTITLSGIVRAYAGYLINHAAVVLKISGTQSTDQFIRNLKQTNREETVVVQTNTEGKFEYRFKATGSSDPAASTYYQIQATVTDRNGETHSNRKSFLVRNREVNLQLSLSNTALTNRPLSIQLKRINTENLEVNGKTRIVLQKLQAPNELLRNRLWEQPDIHLYTRLQYRTWFPNDVYADENNPDTWSATFDSIVLNGTKGNEILSIQSNILTGGWYRVNAETTDTFGNPIKQSTYILLINPNKPEENPKTFFAHTVHKDHYQPGDTAQFTTWSSIPKRVIIRKKQQSKEADFYFIKEAKGLHVLSHHVKEADRGNIAYSEYFVYLNRQYTVEYPIQVAWLNKQLKVSHRSFRDNTTPGAAETWSITVHNADSNTVSAEVLSSLYDASLDAIQPHQWSIPYIWQTRYYSNEFNPEQNFAQTYGESIARVVYWDRGLLNRFLQLAVSGISLMDAQFDADKIFAFKGIRPSLFINPMNYGELNEVVVAAYSTQKKQSTDLRIRGNTSIQEESYDKVFSAPAAPIPTEENEPIQIRSNFNETAFFFPQLYTDSTGSVRFSFTMPDALTKWKWQTLAHTKDLSFGMATDFITTSKKLMVQANAPRFLREGDRIEFSSKIVNTTQEELSGQVELTLIDPFTDRPVDGWFQNSFPNQYFTAAAGQTVVVKFPIQVPISYTKPLQWKLIARSGNISDGETNYLPVLSNRTLVTESVPLLLRGKETKQYTLDKLLKDESASRTQEGIIVSYTTNPIWYAVQALPYLSNNGEDCAEQVFNRFNANSMAALIAKQQPAIAAVLEAWKKDSTATKSALEKNASLKQIVLDETPWVNAAEAESLQKKELAVLFDIARMNSEGKNTLEKLKKLQLPNGAFPWFSGGNANSYITNYILTGLGRLVSLRALSKDESVLAAKLIQPALNWMDAEMEQRFKQQPKNKQAFIWIPTVEDLSYLHMRSYFIQQYPVKNNVYKTLITKAKQHWNKQNNYRAALTAQILFRNGEEAFVRKTILPSLLERTVIDTTNASLYWKQRNTYFWYASPIDHQSMMIETLQLLNKDGKLQQTIQQASNWLLLNKQTTNWGNSMATANACYALLMNGEQWLQTKNSVRIQLGNFVLNSDNLPQEAGTGFLQKRIDTRFVQPEMGKIQVSSNNPKGAISWGSIFWQYFEDMDKITPAANNPLSIEKQFFVERTTQAGNQLIRINDGDELTIGDKLISRIQINAARDMDFVHLKDLRPAGTEPENILSGYQWQNRLGYYMSTKDVSNNYYFDRIPKGNHVIEYNMYVTHAGKFSAGVASIQCLYAPEFTGHSRGFSVFVQSAD